MPTADVLSDRQVMLQLYSIGERFRLGASGTTFGSAEIGLFDRFELGFDSDFKGSTSYNIKFKAFELGRITIAGGILAWATGADSPYAVAKADLKQIRLHVGFLKDDAQRLMLGLDGDLPKGWSYMLDYASGPGGTVWGGLNYSGLEGFTFYASLGYCPGRPLQHSAGIYFYFKL